MSHLQNNGKSNAQLKLFTAIQDDHVDDYLEQEVLKWVYSTPHKRNILSAKIAVTERYIVLMIIFNEEVQPITDIAGQADYLYTNSKQILGRKITREDMKQMNYPEAVLSKLF